MGRKKKRLLTAISLTGLSMIISMVIAIIVMDYAIPIDNILIFLSLTFLGVPLWLAAILSIILGPVLAGLMIWIWKSRR